MKKLDTQMYLYPLMHSILPDMIAAVELWQEYIQFALGFLEIEEVRAILEKGLNAAGMHVSQGSLLWDMLREIELAHLSTAKPETDEWQSQLDRVYEVFKRQLSVPLLDMENTHEEFNQWLQQLPEEHRKDTKAVTWGYNKALKTLGEKETTCCKMSRERIISKKFCYHDCYH